MKSKVILAFILFSGLYGLQRDTQLFADDWRQWRGPLMTGEAPNEKPPTKWSETENVKWKTAIAGLGHSSPVVTGDFIFLTYAKPVGKPFPPRPDTAPGAHDNKLVDSRYEFFGVAVSKKSGKPLWERKLHSAIPHEGAHLSASLASASPVTDGEKVWFFFGSYGLYCLDLDGKLIWDKSLGRMNSKHGHGEGATPVLYQNKLAINWDHEGDSFVVVLNKNSGEVVWQKEREEVTSWASPIVVEHQNRPQLIIAGTERIRGYDLETGQIIWQCGGMSNNIVATPVHSNGLVFFGSSYEIRRMLAIRLEGASGDITSSDHVVWSKNARTPYVPSPLLVDGHLYFLRHYQGIMTRLEATTGDEPSGPFRIGRMNEIYASPVSANGNIYITDRSGYTAVITTGEEPDNISFNRLNETSRAACRGPNSSIRSNTSRSR
ncbi:MAG: PQQ-binding-like beta-propeller repeat protein [Planctomycetota bacterium]